MSDKILYYPDEDKHESVEEFLRQGESLTSANEGIALDKFQNIIVTEKTPRRKDMSKELSVEERILKDYRDKGEVIWHTYSKSEPLPEMDLDFKVLAAIHSLKMANKLCAEISHYTDEWREKATERMNTFMYIFNDIEKHLKEEHGIELPGTVEDIKELRKQLSSGEVHTKDDSETSNVSQEEE